MTNRLLMLLLKPWNFAASFRISTKGIHQRRSLVNSVTPNRGGKTPFQSDQAKPIGPKIFPSNPTSTIGQCRRLSRMGSLRTPSGCAESVPDRHTNTNSLRAGQRGLSTMGERQAMSTTKTDAHLAASWTCDKCNNFCISYTSQRQCGNCMLHEMMKHAFCGRIKQRRQSAKGGVN